VKIGLVSANPHRLHVELASAVEAAAGEAGIQCDRLDHSSSDAEYDAVLLLGSPSDYQAVIRREARSRRICWIGEPLPISPPTASQMLLRAVPSPSFLDVASMTVGRLAARSGLRKIARWRERAATEREFGRNLAELRSVHGRVAELVVTSTNRQLGARLAGWEARVVPFGYHASMCGPVVPPSTGERDIDVLVLGRDVVGATRRARLLRELEHRSLRVQIVDRGLYGAERHALLARTRVLLELLRVPGNTSGIRYLLATSAGAAVVSESTHDSWPAGVDAYVVQGPAERLADEVSALLADEPRRRALVGDGQALLGDELSMANSLIRVLAMPH
jgi:hypothetical protein